MRFLALLFTSLWLITAPASASDPLPSWQKGPTKQRILHFVQQVSDPKSPLYVKRDDRIAVFDSDGTLIVEQPAYIEVVQMMARLKSMAEQNPTLRDQPGYRAALEGDLNGLLSLGSAKLIQLIAQSSAGLSAEDYRAQVDAWLKTSKHPRFQKRYDELAYQPMLEMIKLLKQHGFKVFVVTGSNAEFVRTFSQRVYGIPPENVVGSLSKLGVEEKDGRLQVLREPQMDLINDGKGKPVGISYRIGKRPLLAFGNSDGDYEMLQWTTEGQGPRLGVIIHHDDGKREYRYDRQSHVGRLDRALNDAQKRNWLIVSMERDWRRVFPSDRATRPQHPK